MFRYRSLGETVPRHQDIIGNVINALVFSQLYFCSPVWSSASKKNISKLQKVQNFKNFNARIITNTWKFDNLIPVLQELRWLSAVSYYLMYTVGVLAFKCAKGLAPIVATWVIALWQDLLFMIATQEITTILIFQLINRLQVNELFYIESN